MTPKKKLSIVALGAVAIIALLSGKFLYKEEAESKIGSKKGKAKVSAAVKVASLESDYVPLSNSAKDQIQGPAIIPPPPPSVELMKKKGCVADGLLSGDGGDTQEAISMINRSECQYLHRALETWLEGPDFEKARKIKNQITRPDIVYGMFIAEALYTDKKHYPSEYEDFNFSKMCKPRTKNKWGEHTCVPSFKRKEYRKYVEYITEQAMDMGVQSFMFGQVFYPENNDLSKPVVPKIIANMRKYADSLGMKIVVGAQTNDITNEKYLRNFDYIEGGVGIDNEGNVEDGPCYSRWYKEPGDWCWALLWNDQFKSKANNVFLHLDWSGVRGDDMSKFTLMDDETRAKTLKKLHAFFTSRGDGFLMPMLAVLPKDNGGCHGAKKGFYLASDEYSCKDESVINEILQKSVKTDKK